jgi:2-(1,2-epoxy-1,2-dihydrophenyl)acetyl-CoA isomerase
MAPNDFLSFTCALDNGLARVHFNRPERGNVIDGTFCRELKQLAVCLSESEAVRAVLITAAGRFFSVGGDIRSFAQDRSALPSLVRTWTADLHSAIARLIRMPAPVVAAVQGDVAGGAVSLMASADVVYAADAVKFSAGFPLIGFSADSGSTVTLSQRMGVSRAKRFLLTGETLDAPAALACGLIDFVTPPETLTAEAEKAARAFAAGPKLAYAGVKQLMAKARSQGLESQMEDEASTLATVARSEDAWEGISAFLEKRPPVFKGK